MSSFPYPLPLPCLSSIGDGYWAFDGVKKTSVSEDSEGRMVVRCTATHLTSFAVLVDVAASTTGGDDDVSEYHAFSISK